MLSVIIVLLLVFLNMRRRIREEMEREAERLNRSHESSIQAVDSLNDINHSDSSNPFNLHNNRVQYGSGRPAHSNFINPVRALGLPLGPRPTPVSAPPSYVSNPQPPHN
jgi:hypothetical protein